MSTEVEEALGAVKAREEALREYIEHKGWCQYRLHDYSDEWPCTCGLADVWDGSGEAKVLTQYVLIADHLEKRIRELREALEACEAREAIYRSRCLHHSLCGWRYGQACDCWMAEVGKGDAALAACLEEHTAPLRQALGMARGIIETMTAEHDEGWEGPCDCDVCLRGREFLEMCDEVSVESDVGEGEAVIREASRVET